MCSVCPPFFAFNSFFILRMEKGKESPRDFVKFVWRNKSARETWHKRKWIAFVVWVCAVDFVCLNRMRSDVRHVCLFETQYDHLFHGVCAQNRDTRYAAISHKDVRVSPWNRFAINHKASKKRLMSIRLLLANMRARWQIACDALIWSFVKT